MQIRFVDLENLSEEIARANMRTRTGQPFSEALVDQDIRSLYATGLFEGIEVRREVSGGVVNLLFELRPKYRVALVNFVGNERIGTRRLMQEIKTVPNGGLDERQIKADARTLFEFYQKNGYSQVSVDYTLERNRVTGRANVTFRVSEGVRVKIQDVEFVGNEKVKSGTLRGEMETRRWWWLSWLTGSGRFKDDLFEEDLDKLRDYYRERGYLDVAIDRERIEFVYPTAKKVRIRIPVSEGRQYQVGEITFTGNKLYPTVLLQRLLRVATGDVFAPSKLDEDVDTLRDFYGRDGYLETSVRLLRKPNIQTGNIDVEYSIRESGKFSVESLKIEGNTKTRSNAIVREMVLAPGDTFDTVRMKISEQRLRNTRFFGEEAGRDQGADLSPETVNVPDRKNLKIVVREGRTGNLSFGAGFSSLESAVVFAELTQGNFDMFNWRSFFQGDGQKFRLRFQIGSESSEAILSFEEPWVFERQLAMGFSLFRATTDYVSDFYDELRTGFELYLRKRLFELVEGRLSYSWQSVEYTNISDPTLIQGETEFSISRIGLTLLRDTRDSLVTTTRGNRLEFTAEIAGNGVGLGGTEDFYRLEFRGAQFFPVARWHKQVVSVVARTGVVQAYGRNETRWALGDGVGGYLQVPLSERFYLGGPQTLRGFEYRAVSPRSATQGIIGGKTYGLFSAEYSIEIVDPIRFAVFYDAGFVNVNGYDFDPTEYNDNWGVGLRIFVLGAPLQLDYGIPITTSDFNDEGAQFNFSFGTRF